MLKGNTGERRTKFLITNNIGGSCGVEGWEYGSRQEKNPTRDGNPRRGLWRLSSPPYSEADIYPTPPYSRTPTLISSHCRICKRNNALGGLKAVLQRYRSSHTPYYSHCYTRLLYTASYIPSTNGRYTRLLYMASYIPSTNGHYNCVPKFGHYSVR